MVERNAGVAPDKRIEFRIGIHLGDVVEESDGDLMGDGVNIAARLEGVAKPGGDLHLRTTPSGRSSRDSISRSASLAPVPLKNIAEPMRVYSLEVWRARPRPDRRRPKRSGEAKERPSDVGPSCTVCRQICAALFCFCVVASGGYIFTGRSAFETGGRRASFHRGAALHYNLSGDPAQDYFAERRHRKPHKLISPRIRDSFVIARNTAFTYKGKNIDAKEIGKELGVRYVLEGSAQRDQIRVRVNAQLIDAETGAHLWADRFDEDVTDLFKLQDQVVARRLPQPLATSSSGRKAKGRLQLQNPDAIDLVMLQGVAAAVSNHEGKQRRGASFVRTGAGD